MENDDVANGGPMNASSRVECQLQRVIDELQSQREDVQSLKQELQGNTFSVASEVKKLRKEQELVWKFQGNKIQFTFNTELEDLAKQIIWANEHSKLDYSKELLEELTEKLRKRNKLIRIADGSPGGWDTVKSYESNPIASDSEDDAKINKAENRALKRKRSSSRGGKGSQSYGNHPGSSGYYPSKPWGATAPSYQSTQPLFPRGQPFRGFYGAGKSTASGTSYGTAPGPCYACGNLGHVRRDCPSTSGRNQWKQQTTGK